MWMGECLLLARGVICVWAGHWCGASRADDDDGSWHRGGGVASRSPAVAHVYWASGPCLTAAAVVLVRALRPALPPSLPLSISHSTGARR